MIPGRSSVRLRSAAIALLLGLVGVGAAVPSPDAAITTGDVTVTVVPDANGALVPGQDLVVRVAIHNGTSRVLADGAARLFLDRDVVGSTSALAAWLAPESTSASDDLGAKVDEVATTSIAPGSTQTAVLTLPAASMGLGTGATAWGTRTLAVRVTAGDAEVGQGRSTIVWNPTPAYTPVQIALAMPLSTPAGTEGLISREALEFYTAPTGLLTRQLDAVIDGPVAIGIDPMVLASIRILGSSAPPTATAWLERLAAATNETFALSYADSDITAALQAGATAVVAPEAFDYAIDPTLFAAPGEETPAPTDGPTPTPTAAAIPELPTTESLLAWDYTLTGIAWPSDGTVVASDLATLGATGYTTTILSDSNVARDAASATPSAASTLGEQSVLVSDSVLSALAREAARATSDLAWNDAMARLSGAVAVIAAERRTQSATVLATLGRGWPPSGFHLAETIDALSTLGWSSTVTFSTAMASAPTTATLVDRPQPAERTERVSQLLSASVQEAQFATAVEDPATITAERRQAMLALLALAWNSNQDGWPAAVVDFLTESVELRSSVQIVESSTINLATRSAPIPITVSNSLDQPVTVFVTVRALTPILAVEDQRVELTIEPDSQAKAQVPVKSISNGTVRLQVSLSSGAGVGIGGISFFTINVQAEWETAGALVVAALVVLVFGFGLYRNIAKRRRERSKADTGDEADAAANDTADVAATGADD